MHIPKHTFIETMSRNMHFRAVWRGLRRLWRAPPTPGRRQFNFPCDSRLRLTVKALAASLGCPIYVLAEHVMDLGLQELAVILRDETLKEKLQRHLLQEHLLVTGLPPEHGTVSQRAERLRNCLEFLWLYEVTGVPFEEIAEALDALAAR